VKSRWHSERCKKLTHVHPLVVSTCLEQFREELAEGETVFGWTEIRLGSLETVRAHPNCRGEGAWWDWVLLRDATDQIVGEDSSLDSSQQGHSPSTTATANLAQGENLAAEWVPAPNEDLFAEHGLVLGKLLGFVGTNGRGPQWALVHVAEPDAAPLTSPITQRWNLLHSDLPGSTPDGNVLRRPVTRLVSLSQLKKRVFVVEETPGVDETRLGSSLVNTDKLHLVQSYQCWKKMFLGQQLVSAWAAQSWQHGGGNWEQPHFWSCSPKFTAVASAPKHAASGCFFQHGNGHS